MTAATGRVTSLRQDPGEEPPARRPSTDSTQQRGFFARGLAAALARTPGAYEAVNDSSPRPPLRGLQVAFRGVPRPPPAEGESTPLDSNPAEEDLESVVSVDSSGRARVAQNRRILEMEVWTYSCPIMCFVALLALTIIVVCAAIYIQGWLVVIRYGNKPCDQPLKWWVMTMLSVPIVQCHLLVHQAPNDQTSSKLRTLVRLVVLFTGSWMCSSCKTCEKTNPELYHYAHLCFWFALLVWVTLDLISCGLVFLVFWMHRNGLLETGPGPAAAAREGLIEDLETLPFHPSLCSAQGDELQPECPICHEEFIVDAPIKRTPCKHIFHEECLGNWLGNYGKSCPMCRSDLEEAVDQMQPVNNV